MTNELQKHLEGEELLFEIKIVDPIKKIEMLLAKPTIILLEREVAPFLSASNLRTIQATIDVILGEIENEKVDIENDHRGTNPRGDCEGCHRNEGKNQVLSTLSEKLKEMKDEIKI